MATEVGRREEAAGGEGRRAGAEHGGGGEGGGEGWERGEGGGGVEWTVDEGDERQENQGDARMRALCIAWASRYAMTERDEEEGEPCEGKHGRGGGTGQPLAADEGGMCGHGISIHTGPETKQGERARRTRADRRVLWSSAGMSELMSPEAASA
ncbi:hypothetical protein GUITHDRAFT_149643 [Guillardia theta CCMP2712]|uniref:Uncharacterized protein n=1 Tax=Guillardia theta (strain CCMP2712) TaxID=905079 RepID=L1I476_GUITC|nr:hypothetical protein GUITHDRAFT_149643 [Guillardia theta CCMP2712]EKX30852.1 hypothetical protein GUITHDRAFT_149643 [Guillardia theta CCMP2712]|eukprot:XP_005817832.1 hypothetical protein GUITHDRAFT_149643 [Guillardia theta CCMP2712]